MTIKGILFDFDGTLANTTELIIASFKNTISHFLHREASVEEITQYFGLPLRECLAHYDANRVEEMVDYYREYNNHMHDSMIKSYPDVEKTLRLLKQAGIKFAIVTSKKSPMALRGLRCLQLDKYFECIIGCEKCLKSKPDPEPMFRGLQALGLTGKDCLCVGDSPFDLLSGQAVGCQTVKVGWSEVPEQTFANLITPDYTIANMLDLLDIIKSINEKERGKNA